MRYERGCVPVFGKWLSRNGVLVGEMNFFRCLASPNGAPFRFAMPQPNLPMKPHISACLVALSAIHLPLQHSAAGPMPAVEVTNVRRVFHNGEHNAFTDLIRWQGKFWLTFRSCPSGHGVDSAASIIVLSSEDAKTWKQVHRFAVPDRDTRDPHFLDFKGRLFIYTGTWWSGGGPLPREKYDLNKHLGYAAWTADGKTWEGPRQLEGTYGHYIWRAAAHGGTAYLCARRKRAYSENESGAGGTPIVESALLESEDGLLWRFRSFFQETLGNETAFQFTGDGSILAVSRAPGQKAQVARSRPPYLEWDRLELPHHVGGPLLAKWGDRWLVGGRRSGGADGEGPKTALYWLGTDDALHQFADLPSGGDNSYPGFVELSPTQGLISWYSSHEKDEAGSPMTAIYLADLRIVE